MITIDTTSLIITLALIFLALASGMTYLRLRKIKFEEFLGKRNLAQMHYSPKPINYSMILNIAILLLLAIILSVNIEISNNPNKSNVNVLFLSDVSISMNATDVSPSRLEYSKTLIKRSLDALKNVNTGLIVFAGDAFQAVPLTLDKSYVSLYLNSIKTDLIDNQGSNLEKALLNSIGKFPSNEDQRKYLIIISDGEFHSGSASAVTKLLKDSSITVISCIVGDSKGAKIPIQGLTGAKYLEYNGEEVITKANPTILRNISDFYIDSNLGIENSVAKIKEIINPSLTNSFNFDKNLIKNLFIGMILLLFILKYKYVE